MSYLSMQHFIDMAVPRTVELLPAVRLFVVLAVAGSILALLRLEWRRQRYSRWLPGRKNRFLSVFGNIKDVQVAAENRNGLSFNHFLLQALSGYGRLFPNEKLFCFWISYYPFVCLTKAEALEEVISSANTMEKSWLYSFLHPWLGTGLLTSRGAKWKSRRRLLTPSFHFDILREFLPVFEDKSRVLVSRLEGEVSQDFTDIVLPVTLCSLDIICETTLGISIGAQENEDSQYVKSVGAVSDIIFERMLKFSRWTDYPFLLTKPGLEFKKHIKLLHDFTTTVIREKKRKLMSGDPDALNRKRKAFMDVLLEHHLKNDAFTEEDIREEVDTFAFEGHDTTSMGMTWALYLIGLHKDIQEKVHEELDRIFGDDLERPVTTEDLNDMKYMDRVLKESQRLYPSVPIIGRHVKEDTIVCGKRVPKGATCAIMTILLHRDPKVFPDPEKFDPDRFLPENSASRSPFAYIPFSAGSRNCIGQRFAIMEEKVVLSTVLRHFTLESLDPRDRVHTTPDLVLRPVGPVRVRIRRRQFP